MVPVGNTAARCSTILLAPAGSVRPLTGNLRACQEMWRHSLRHSRLPAPTELQPQATRWTCPESTHCYSITAANEIVFIEAEYRSVIHHLGGGHANAPSRG
jgi:hypothetical protein